MTGIMRLVAIGIAIITSFAGVVLLAAAPNPNTALKVDHATVCGSDLDALRVAFASVGLTSDYGGPHGNGVTQMALIGFDDGSYLELIAPVKADDPKLASGSEWAKFIVGNAGPCAWAVGSSDIRGDVERLKKAGIQISGQSAGSRRKPDGTTIEWEAAQVGGTAGSLLPFMIQDKTPRELRVKPSASVKSSGLTGIAVVIIGVKDFDAAIASFRRAYGLEAPPIEDHKEFGAKLAYFEGTPVVLAAPFDSSSWLAERLAKFDESPVAYLLGTSDFSGAAKKYTASTETSWFGQKVAWFEVGKLRGARLGLIGR